MRSIETSTLQSLKFPTPAISNYWEAVFTPPGDLGNIDINYLKHNDNGKLPITSATFETGELDYITEEIFWQKIRFLKNVKPLSSVTINYIEDENFTFTKFLKKWHFEFLGKNGQLFRTYGVGAISSSNLNFCGKLKIVKFKQDWKTPILEFEAYVIPTGNLSFNFDYNGSVLEKSVTFDVIKLEKFEVF